MSDSDREEENSGSENVIEEKGSDTDISVSVAQSLPSRASGKQASRKRSRSSDSWESGLADLTKVFGTYIEHRNELMNMLVKRIGYDHDASDDRRRVIDEVRKLSDLSLRDQLRAATLIVTHQYKVDLFFSLPDNEKGEWVAMLLDGVV